MKQAWSQTYMNALKQKMFLSLTVSPNLTSQHAQASNGPQFKQKGARNTIKNYINKKTLLHIFVMAIVLISSQ